MSCSYSTAPQLCTHPSLLPCSNLSSPPRPQLPLRGWLRLTLGASGARGMGVSQPAAANINLLHEHEAKSLRGARGGVSDRPGIHKLLTLPTFYQI